MHQIPPMKHLFALLRLGLIIAPPWKILPKSDRVTKVNLGTALSQRGVMGWNASKRCAAMRAWGTGL